MSGAVMREDNEQMQSFIGAIAKALVELLDEDWEQVIFARFRVGEKLDPHHQLHVDMGDGFEDLLEKIWDDPDYDDAYFDLTDLVDAFHAYCKSCGDDWTSFCLRLENTGRFRCDYGYEPIAQVDRHFVLDWQSENLI